MYFTQNEVRGEGEVGRGLEKAFTPSSNLLEKET